MADGNDLYNRTPEGIVFEKKAPPPSSGDRARTAYLTSVLKNPDSRLFPALKPSTWAEGILNKRFPKPRGELVPQYWGHSAKGGRITRNVTRPITKLQKLKYNLKPSTLARGAAGFLGTYAATDSAIQGVKNYANKGIDTRRRYMGELEEGGVDVRSILNRQRHDDDRYARMRELLKSNKKTIDDLSKLDDLDVKNRKLKRGLEKRNANYEKWLGEREDHEEMYAKARRLTQQAVTGDHISGKGQSKWNPFRYLDMPGREVGHFVGKASASYHTPKIMKAAAARLRGAQPKNANKTSFTYDTGADVLDRLAKLEQKYKLSPSEVATLIPKLVYENDGMKRVRDHIRGGNSKYNAEDYGKLHDIAVGNVITSLYDQGYRGL